MRRDEFLISTVALYSAAMQRFIILLVLAVLPLQVTWAAGARHCPHDGDYGVSVSVPGDASHATHVDEHEDDSGGGGYAAESVLDCSAFHFVALDPLAAPKQWLPQAGATTQAIDNAAYKSHIPDGPDRPRWRFAA